MRLDKLLSNMGYGTRKEIKQAARQGLIDVDGKAVTDSGLHIAPHVNSVTYRGEKVIYNKFSYIMINKPQGVISATYDNKYKTVLDLLPDSLKRPGLFPMGRLDRDTEGLVIITNDGETAHKILSPRNHVSKKYYAHISGKTDNEDVQLFGRGLVLKDGYKCMQSNLRIVDSSEEASKVIIEIFEGKFHQIKRMFEAVGKKVVYLKRIEIAGIKLDETLGPGRCRELHQEEINKLKKILKD